MKRKQNNEQPLVSVIIPAFNAEKFISEAIDSVLEQTYQNVECIVVDDGSTDATADIIKGYGSRVHYIHQENSERSAARNRGLADACGEYVAFLDADDFLVKNKIYEQLTFLEDNEQYDVVYSGVNLFEEKQPRIYLPVSPCGYSGDILDKLVWGNFIFICSPLIRKVCIDRIGGFNTGYKYNEDWEYWLRMAIAGLRFGYLDSLHVCCRKHSANTSKDKLNMYKGKLQVIQDIANEHRETLHARGVESESVVSLHRAAYGRLLVLTGDVDNGLALISQSLKVKFPNKVFYWLFNQMGKLIDYRVLDKMHRFFGLEL